MDCHTVKEKHNMILASCWSGQEWVGECFFWYQFTQVVPEKGLLNGICCCCCFSFIIFNFMVPRGRLNWLPSYLHHIMTVLCCVRQLDRVVKQHSLRRICLWDKPRSKVLQSWDHPRLFYNHALFLHTSYIWTSYACIITIWVLRIWFLLLLKEEVSLVSTLGAILTLPGPFYLEAF